ncbi:MAG: PAS domain-containing protein [Candidatus Promineifilaceae bacterium]
MILDVLSNHVIEMFQANDELNMRLMVNTAGQTSLSAIESHSRSDPTTQRTIDLQTLLMVTNSATLFLDQQLNIKQFTPKVRELFDFLPKDQGQPLTRLSDRLDCTSLVDDAFEVLRSRTHIERETRNQADQWFLMRMLPYHTLDDRVDGVIITFLDITQLKETEARLKQSQQQIEALTERLETVMVEQRQQMRQLVSEMLVTEQKVQQTVAQVLHDELQQILFSLQMQIDDMLRTLPGNEPLLLERVRKLREVTNLAFTITRQVAIDLNPKILLNEGFAGSFPWLADLMKDRYGLEVEVKVTVGSGWPGPEVSTLLFQMARELLFNVVKHAGVKQAQIEVVAEDDRLSLTVSDQGLGFDVAAALTAGLRRGGMGLPSIRSRLELLGGQFSITSQANLGTRVTVVVPM